MLMLLGVATSESMNPRPFFHHCNTICAHVYHLFACCPFYCRFILLCFAIHITCHLTSLRRTSAPIHLTSVLGVLGTEAEPQGGRAGASPPLSIGPPQRCLAGTSIGFTR